MRPPNFIALVYLVLVFVKAANAESVSIVTTERAVTTIDQQATRWGLTAKEWSRFQNIMAGRRGVWSPNLDPITALGVAADTTAQRNHFAELYVRVEFDRTRKELAFQLAVDRAWQQLYPDTPKLQARAIPKVNNDAITRYAVVVSNECTACTITLNERLAAMLAEATEGIDVHVVGLADNDTALRDWLAQQPQLHSAFTKGRATVNHGDAFTDVASFPVIYAKTASGQWSREL